MLENEIDLRGSGASAGRSWTGAGGRWLLWPLRVVLWATLLIIAYRSMTAIVFHHASALPADGAEPGGGAAAQFPVTLADAYATEFGQAYRMSVRELQSGKWYVNEISAAIEAVGAK